MIIEYYTHKPELSKIRTIQIGHKIVGLRVLEVTITSQEELEQLLSEEGVKWAHKHLRFPSKKLKLPDVTPGVPEDWGDIVDPVLAERERCQRWAHLYDKDGYVLDKILSGEPAPE